MPRIDRLVFTVDRPHGRVTEEVNVDHNSKILVVDAAGHNSQGEPGQAYTPEPISLRDFVSVTLVRDVNPAGAKIKAV